MDSVAKELLAYRAGDPLPSIRQMQDLFAIRRIDATHISQWLQDSGFARRAAHKRLLRSDKPATDFHGVPAPEPVQRQVAAWRVTYTDPANFSGSRIYQRWNAALKFAEKHQARGRDVVIERATLTLPWEVV